MRTLSFVLLAAGFGHLCAVNAFMFSSSKVLSVSKTFQSKRGSSFLSATSSDDSEQDEKPWDADVNYEEEWPQGKLSPDPTTSWDALPVSVGDEPILGIDIPLDPLSKEDLQELKKEAGQVIEDAFAAGLQDVERIRSKLNRELKASRQATELASQLQGQQAQEALLKKIDDLSETFLAETAAIRQSTKQAAAASRAMEGTGQGLEMGTWGVLGGRAVLAESLDSGSPAKTFVGLSSPSSTATQPAATQAQAASNSNLVLVIADTKQDPYARQLIPILERHLAETIRIPNVQLQVVSPTASMPLGGNNAACLVVFCTSLTSSASLKKMLDTLLRKTLQSDGQLGSPPTQIVGVTTVGTERTNVLPYSMQNLMGGKLEARRQIEEQIISTVRKRAVEPPMDFTLIKLGELKDKAKSEGLTLVPGDALDDPVTANAAAFTLMHAMALQPTARNATLSVSGNLEDMWKFPPEDEEERLSYYSYWANLFLPLEGPQVWTQELTSTPVDKYDQLVEFLREWAQLLADPSQKKGLTTPIQAIMGNDVLFTKAVLGATYRLVQRREGIQLLFLPTATGKNYLSKDEEKQQKKEGSNNGNTSPDVLRRARKEGGLMILVEVTSDDVVRVRARRTNYADDAIIKEISEATILKRLEDALQVWKSNLES